jgi:ATP-binding cassette subfamily B protein
VNRARRSTLWELTRGHRRLYLAAVLAMALSNVFLFGIPLVTKDAIDGLTGPGGATTRDLLAAGCAIALLTVIAAVCLYARGRWAALASEAIVRGLRGRLFEHLERLPCAYHDRADTGDLVQRCTSDVETVRVFLTAQVVEIGRTVLLVVTVLPILVWLDPWMTAVSLALFPPILIFAVLFFRRVQSLFLDVDRAEGEMTTVLQENLSGIRVVRAFARQEHECGKFGAKNALFRDRSERLIRFLGVYWGFSDFLCFAQSGVALLFGAWWVAEGRVTVGTLFAFLSYLGIIIWPVRHLGRVLTDTGKAIVALGRIREILEVPEESAVETGPRPAAALRGTIEVQGLTFAHAGGEPVLRRLDFRVEAGQTLALLGPPGSGKSTFVHLLLRLYDYEQGSIRLDGRELSTMDRSFVRSAVGVVLQEPFLYSKSIAANVKVGRADATHEQIVESATAACIHEAVAGFPGGYETLIGERGVTLSGGQRQRLAIARALLKDPAVLVLDDALSAVDTETEARILEALRRRQGRRTTILIAHRLSSVLHADRILVLDHGRIVQSGTHAELAEAAGPYRRLWQIQSDVEEEMMADLGGVREDGR